jgi:hypothetical protein
MTKPSFPARTVTASTKELGRSMNPADVARAKGWGEGTRIVGNEGHGPTVIEITEVTRSRLFAKRISHNGVPVPERGDTSWVLYCRDWTKV